MPVPEGEITTSEIFAPQVEETADDFDVVFEINEDKIPWEEVKEDLGLPDDLS
jgi:hypothetical protein